MRFRGQNSNRHLTFQSFLCNFVSFAMPEMDGAPHLAVSETAHFSSKKSSLSHTVDTVLIFSPQPSWCGYAIIV